MNVESPNIHLIKSPYGYYIYDINKNKLVDTQKAVYDILSSDQKAIESLNPQVYAEAQEQITALKEEGFLSSRRVSVIEHPKTELLESILSSNLLSVTLQVTQQCNLRCHYCLYTNPDFQRAHSNNRMSFETAKKCIDFLIRNSRDSRHVMVSFYGGEPLLEFDLIKRCIEYAEVASEGKQIGFNLTTNATLINEEIIEYFSMHQVRMMISLDGPKTVHDKNRRLSSNGCGSYDKVMESLNLIRTKFPDYLQYVSFNAVLDTTNDYRDVIDFYESDNLVKDIFTNTQLANDKFTREKFLSSEGFIIQQRYEIFKLYLHKLGEISNESVSKHEESNFTKLRLLALDIKEKAGITSKAHPSGPCVPGENRLFINFEGYFYACERVSEVSAPMNIGHIDKGFDFKKAKSLLNIGKLTEKQCKNCWAFIYCNQCCLQADNMKELSGRARLSHCVSTKKDLENRFRDYIAFKELGYSFIV